MKVLHVATVDLTVDKLLRGVLADQARRGWEVHVACNGDPQILDRVARRESLAAYHIVPLTRDWRWASDLRALAILWRLMRRHRFDVVHTSTPKAGLIGNLAARASRSPRVVHTLRGLPYETLTGLRRTITKGAVRVTIATADIVIAISGSIADMAATTGAMTTESAVVLGAGSSNGLDTDRYRAATLHDRAAARQDLGLSEDEFAVLYVGRICRDKGFEEFVTVSERLHEKHPDVRCLVVGPVEEPDLVDRLVPSARGVPIEMAGLVDDLWRYYAAADVLLFPSYREGFGNAILEAAAVGTTTVAYRATGVVDAVVDGVTGLLVDPHDVDALAAAVEELRADPVRRHALASAAQQRAHRDFRPQAIWDGIARLYEGDASV